MQRANAQAQRAEADPVEFRCRGAIAVVLPEKHEPGDGKHAERQIDVEHPTPVIGLGEIPAERGAKDGANHYAHAPERHRRAALLDGVEVQQGRLRQRRQPRAEHPLQQPENHHLLQAFRRAAKHRRNRETAKASHEKRLAAKARRKPADGRGHDGGGDDVRGQHPGDLVRRGR